MAETDEARQYHGVGHPQVFIQVDEWSAEVDEKLAPLITEMWKAGIETIMSYQQHDTPEFAEHGNPTSWVWLNLPTPDAQVFCSIVAGNYDRPREHVPAYCP